MIEIKNKEEYNKVIGIEIDPTNQILTPPILTDKEKWEKYRYRLDKIHDIRKFEIDLYWKRGAYFWTFLVAAFTVYGLTVGKPGTENIKFIALCLGLVFSISFYMVNKASKFWQRNWERHLDFLEEAVYGPLYEITLPQSPVKKLMIPTSEYSASVSRINMMLSLFICCVWICLLIEFSITNYLVLTFEKINWFYTIGTILTLCFSISILVFTRSDLPKSKDNHFVFGRT